MVMKKLLLLSVLSLIHVFTCKTAIEYKLALTKEESMAPSNKQTNLEDEGNKAASLNRKALIAAAITAAVISLSAGSVFTLKAIRATRQWLNNPYRQLLEKRASLRKMHDEGEATIETRTETAPEGKEYAKGITTVTIAETELSPAMVELTKEIQHLEKAILTDAWHNLATYSFEDLFKILVDSSFVTKGRKDLAQKIYQERPDTYQAMLNKFKHDYDGSENQFNAGQYSSFKNLFQKTRQREIDAFVYGTKPS